jgi:hypothetical protein
LIQTLGEALLDRSWMIKGERTEALLKTHDEVREAARAPSASRLGPALADACQDKTEVHLFAMILGYSRTMLAIAGRDEKLPAFLRGHEGGSPSFYFRVLSEISQT